MTPTLYEPATYKGYTVALSSGGVKAGAGFNKTGTIQVREKLGGDSYLLRKQFRYPVGATAKMDAAMKKARKWIDKNPLVK